MVKKMKERIKTLLKKDISIITILFLLSRVVLIISIIKNHSLYSNIFDTNHYIEIAKNGYTEDTLYAFFPLFPLLLRLLHTIIPSYEIEALLLSNLFSFLSTLILYNLIKTKKQRIPAITLFLFSPILVFNTIGYTESLYIFLTLTSFVILQFGVFS